MIEYNESDYYIDFSDRDNLSSKDKKNLEEIQANYRPIERVDYLLEYKYTEKITTDDFEKMTGLPYTYD